MWSCSFYFGNFLGPTIGGFLVESFGFRDTSLVFAVLQLKMMLGNLVELGVLRCWGKKNKKKREGYQEIHESENTVT